MKETVSACIVAYNEEAVIERCLESLQGAVDEIILVHDGKCSDNTIAIAKKYHAKISILPHYGDAEHLRIHSFNQATGTWILQMDADEYLSKELQIALPELIKDTNIDAYAFHWPKFNGTTYLHKGYIPDNTKTVLFRKSKMYYLAMTHERIQTTGTTQTRRDLVLEHKPPKAITQRKNFLAKQNRWLKIQTQEILDLESLDIFQIKDKNTNPRLKRWRQYKKHPLFLTIGLLCYDSIRTVFTTPILFSPKENWTLLLEGHEYYIKLAWRVAKAQRKHKQ